MTELMHEDVTREVIEAEFGKGFVTMVEPLLADGQSGQSIINRIETVGLSVS